MRSTLTGSGFRRVRNRVPGSLFVLGVGLCLGLLPFGVGCPDFPLPLVPTENGNDNQPPDGTDGDVQTELVSFSQNFSLSALDEPVSVIYTVTGQPDAISAVYVPVADASAGAGAIGDPVIIQTGLSAGSNQAFNFDPQVAGVGNYRVGIRVTVDGVSEVFLSEGVLQVQGSPDPRFILPLAAITDVTAGADVATSFDAGDPEGNVQWRLFHLTASDSRSDPPDELGTQLQTGSGNFGSFTFSTLGLPPGDYELGVSATDTGKSIAATVDDGDLSRIITIGSETAPGPIVRVIEEEPEIPSAIAVLAPADSNVSLFLNEPFTIQISASVGPLGATGLIDIFYDLDDNFSNGFTLLNATGLPASTTSFPLPTDLPAGTYFIGASINDGINPTAFDYATGTITVVRTPTLTVTDPSTNLPIAPAPAAAITVAWTTNVPATAGLVDVFAQTLDATGNPFGLEISILAPTSPATTSAVFSSASSGLFQVFVRITFNDEFGVTPLIVSAPQPVRVSSLPPILWLGSLAEASSTFDGAIFEGVQPEDNAGTGFSPAGDLNGDNLGEFVIVSRYGKPFFVNPTGVGSGEAYLIYGVPGANKLSGVYNLNSVGTSILTGVTLTGIPTVGNSEETDGLSDVELIPDSDGDELEELVFGFPRTDSVGANVGPLEAPGQFLNGGVVILSSNNSILRDPTVGTPVIALAAVGQSFSNMAVIGEAGDVLHDHLTFEAGDPDANPPTADACVQGTDGINDTIVGPSIGFIPLLAPARHVQFGFTPIPPGTPPAPEVCVTQYFEPGCGNVLGGEIPGSGFYPVDATPLEPRGARIIGIDEDDGFGTSITHSNALGDDAPGDLIISAPNRTATVAEFAENAIDSDIPNSGVAFLARNRNLCGPDDVFLSGQVPPTPCQYVMRVASHCGDGRAPALGQLSIAGDANDGIQNIIGIDDFNGDGRNDFAVGAPTANGGQGRLYIAYRREVAIEGGFVLGKLKRAINDPERLDGILVVSNSLDALGSSLATGFDFNGDGASDLVIGSPAASGGVGEVIILFGQSGVLSGLNGVSVQDLLQTERTLEGRPVAARITGNPLDNGQFGFNVANAGDVNGDGIDDLLIAAPNATPRFDDTPMDSVDLLSEPGVDVDFDGIKDDVSGPLGIPDNVSDSNDNLDSAGVVYVVYGSNRLDLIPATDVTISVDQLGGNVLRGFIIAGRRAGDRIGGGDAGDTAQGGIVAKLNRGRSYGLATAGDIDGDGRADILVGSILADPRRDPNTGDGVENGGEAYLIYGSSVP